MPPLVTAVLLFLGPASGVVVRHIRQVDLTDAAVLTADRFMIDLDTRRYADASAMLAPEAQAKTTNAEVKSLAQSMQNADGRIVYERDSDMEITTTGDYHAILLTYRVQARTGWKPVLMSILETPTGMKVYSCTFMS